MALSASAQFFAPPPSSTSSFMTNRHIMMKPSLSFSIESILSSHRRYHQHAISQHHSSNPNSFATSFPFQIASLLNQTRHHQLAAAQAAAAERVSLVQSPVIASTTTNIGGRCSPSPPPPMFIRKGTKRPAPSDYDIISIDDDNRHESQVSMSGCLSHSATASSVSGTNNGGSQDHRIKTKRVRTIFTPDQLERLEQEFARQQYMVGPERLALAAQLALTEAQVKVWFQNRRIKWRKQHEEETKIHLARIGRVVGGSDSGPGSNKLVCESTASMVIGGGCLSDRESSISSPHSLFADGHRSPSRSLSSADHCHSPISNY